MSSGDPELKTVDPEQLIRSGLPQALGEFNRKLNTDATAAMRSAFDKPDEYADIISKASDIFSGKDGSVDLPSEVVEQFAKHGLLHGSSLRVGKEVDSIAVGWAEPGKVKNPREGDSEGVWTEYDVRPKGFESPVRAEEKVKLKAGDVDEATDYTTWTLSRGEGVKVWRQ